MIQKLWRHIRWLTAQAEESCRDEKGANWHRGVIPVQHMSPRVLQWDEEVAPRICYGMRNRTWEDITKTLTLHKASPNES